MYSPHDQELVRIRNCSVDFLVVAVNRAKETVDLARFSEPPCLVENVPFADVAPLEEVARVERLKPDHHIHAYLRRLIQPRMRARDSRLGAM